MNTHVFTAVAGAILSIVFLLYYVVYIRSVPLSFIMVAIIAMLCINLFEEAREQQNGDNNNKS